MTTEGTPAKPAVNELDGLRRAGLGNLGRHDRYLDREQGDGALIFEPALVLTEAEAAFLANPALVALIEEEREHADGLRPRTSRS